MASNYWIKLYHEILDDPKMGRLTDRQYRRVIELFLLAGDYEQDGLLPPLEDIEFRLRFPEGIQDDLDVIEKSGIISKNEEGIYYITQWQKRQGAMTDAERSQRWRERQRKLNYYETDIERKCNDSVVDVDVDKDIDIDVDVDVDKDVDVDVEKNNDDDNPSLREQLREQLLTTFSKETAIPMKNKKLRKEDEDALDRMIQAGVRTTDLIGGIYYVRANNYPIIGLRSVVNPAIVEMSKRTSQKRGPNEDYKKYTQGRYAGHIKS
jgi:hypothetical protein